MKRREEARIVVIGMGYNDVMKKYFNVDYDGRTMEYVWPNGERKKKNEVLRWWHGWIERAVDKELDDTRVILF